MSSAYATSARICPVRSLPEGLARPHAYVALKAGHTPSPELSAELETFVRSRGGGYETPAWIDFVDELPKTATGKVQRVRLRNLMDEATLCQNVKEVGFIAAHRLPSVRRLV